MTGVNCFAKDRWMQQRRCFTSSQSWDIMKAWNHLCRKSVWFMCRPTQRRTFVKSLERGSFIQWPFRKGFNRRWNLVHFVMKTQVWVPANRKL
jgi:hypothetical protein